MHTKTVHIVDDEESIRSSMSFFLETLDFEVRAWPSGSKFIEAAAKVEPGAVILDLRMPGLDGLEVLQELAARGMALPVVMLTGHGDISLAVRAMRSGAIDFLEKPVDQTRLVEALDRAFGVLESKANSPLTPEAAQRLVAVLTPREREVLTGLAQGLPNKSIANQLGISFRTVEVYRANIMSKLGVGSLADALRIAFAAGLDRGA